MDQDAAGQAGRASSGRASSERDHVVVVGGGISGLSAAHELRQQGLAVTVLEAAERTGGKIATAQLAGLRLDTGAESILTRRPEALDLIDELGLGEELTYPAAGVPAFVYSRGALRRLPTGQVMGVPGHFGPLARSGVLSPGGLLRAARDWVWPKCPVTEDVAVADFVGRRMGSEVVDRLVEPLLGGVYAGRSEALSLRATMPQLASAAQDLGSASASARTAIRQRDQTSDPPFATLRGGLGRLVTELETQLGAAAQVAVKTRATVRRLQRTGDMWRLTVGCAAESTHVTAAAVVLACPPGPAARLLAEEVPAAAAALGEVTTASMAVVSLAYPRSAVPPDWTASGFLVPPVEQRTIKAATFSSVKWPWLAEELAGASTAEPLAVVRCSIGRVGEEATLQRSDAELVAAAADDLAETAGITAPPVESHVTRWGGALPQYDVGHADRISRVRSALRDQPGLGACGAAFDGVGIAACVAGARAIAREVLTTRTGRTARL